ncbi:putative disease resistance protein RGA1 [Bienertia sinuspersici]
MTAICAVLADAEDKGSNNNAFNIWLRDLKSVVYDIDDLLDEVAYDAKLRKANQGHFTRQLRYYLSSSSPIISRLNLSHKIKRLHEKLDNIVAKKNAFGLIERILVDQPPMDEIKNPLDHAPVYGSSIDGREEAKNDILAKVNAVNGHATKLAVLPIVGMGGIGKTTLAKLVYADVQHFDLKLWVCVSGLFKINQVLKEILKAGGAADDVSNQDMRTLVANVQHLLNGKKYFLVLDDLGEEETAKWNELRDLLDRSGQAGSVILITTRETKIADITKINMVPYTLERLPDHVCWSIFKGLAFSKGEEARYSHLCEIGKSIVEKCCGIPLVVITLGSLLRSERDDKEWQRIDDMDSFMELNQQYHKVMQLLKISYDKLPSHLKPCFAHLSLYVKDQNLKSNMVPYMWSALGFLRVTDEPNGLIDKVICLSKMHDLLHDLAMNILGEELSVLSLDKLIVSEFVRHIVWRGDGIDTLKDKSFPKELLKARNIRTFRFGYEMRHISQSFLEGIISHFSCLRILELSASWFEELPRSIGNLKHLRLLYLSNNPLLRTLPDTIYKLLNLETLNLYACWELKDIPKHVFELKSLRDLTVTTYQNSLVDTKFNKLSCLHAISIDSCMRLESLWETDSAGTPSSLKIFQISNCPKVRCVSKSMRSLQNLEVIMIVDCEELDVGNGEWLQDLRNLRVLVIGGLPKLKTIPDGIRYVAPSLIQFTIGRFSGLVELPDWFHEFSSLHEIVIESCPNLLGLPSTFRCLQSLQKLCIKNCPHVTERCDVFGGEDYPLIQHIPMITLDETVPSQLSLNFLYNHLYIYAKLGEHYGSASQIIWYYSAKLIKRIELVASFLKLFVKDQTILFFYYVPQEPPRIKWD